MNKTTAQMLREWADALNTVTNPVIGAADTTTEPARTSKSTFYELWSIYPCYRRLAKGDDINLASSHLNLTKDATMSGMTSYGGSIAFCWEVARNDEMAVMYQYDLRRGDEWGLTIFAKTPEVLNQMANDLFAKGTTTNIAATGNTDSVRKLERDNIKVGDRVMLRGSTPAIVIKVTASKGLLRVRDKGGITHDVHAIDVMKITK